MKKFVSLSQNQTETKKDDIYTIILITKIENEAFLYMIRDLK